MPLAVRVFAMSDVYHRHHMRRIINFVDHTVAANADFANRDSL